MTSIKATDLEQIDALRRLAVQLQLGLTAIEQAMTGIYGGDFIIEQGGDPPKQDPAALRQHIITTIMSLRRVSSQYIYTMTDIKNRTGGGKAAVPPREAPPSPTPPPAEIPASPPPEQGNGTAGAPETAPVQVVSETPAEEDGAPAVNWE